MKIVAYQFQGLRGLGVVDDADAIIPLAETDPGLPSDLIRILESPDGLDRIRRASAGRRGSIALSDVTLKPFLGRPNAMWALALNFKTHIAETGLTTSPDYPHIFLRTGASFVGHREALRCPPPEVARAFDYEGELAVVIGRAGRHIPPEKASEHIAGYTCLNEGSVREYQIQNRQFGLGKNFEESGSYGPWLMTTDQFGDPARQRVTTRVNGVTRQDSTLDDMLFDVAHVVSYLSEGYCLRPGDLIAMGTPGALKPGPNDADGRDMSKQYGPFKVPGLVHMRPGDLVEVEISGLGILANPVTDDLPREYRAADPI